LPVNRYEESFPGCGNIEFDDIVLFLSLIELCVLSVLWRSANDVGFIKMLPSEFAENES
jgi:hypothetical protein